MNSMCFCRFVFVYFFFFKHKTAYEMRISYWRSDVCSSDLSMKLSAPIFRLKIQAKLLSRETNAPLHASLDEVAKREGYRGWSHLASSSSHDRSAPKLLAHFVAGDLVLLGARPGHGKTLLGLELAVEAARTGHRSFFFSLEETESSISKRLQGLGFDMDDTGNALVIDTSDAICADY